MVPVTPPPKRRRFFKDEDAFLNGAATDTYGIALPEDKKQNIASSEDFRSPGRSSTRGTPSSSPPPLSGEKSENEAKNEPELLVETNPIVAEGLDELLLESITGQKLEAEALAVLRDISNGDMTRAVNFVFDGTLEKHLHPKPKSNTKTQSSVSASVMPIVTVAHVEGANSSEPVPNFKPLPTWKERYVGSFQVEGWATRSGRNLLQFGDEIRLKRVARQVNGNGTKRFGSTIKAKENDIFVRFTNMRGDEIGRLPADKARFVSTLLDLKICIFTGTVIYVDSMLRTGDSIVLQLKCFLSRSAFDNDSGSLNSENSLQYNGFVYKGKETSDERHLRLRQMALIKLFMDIGLEPHCTNDLLRQHSAKGQLEAAAMAEQFDIKVTSNDSSEESEGQDSDEMVEEDKNLEQDQLDSLYRKAQTYDADMPEVEPSNTFNMDLRPYQKQGLGWMISKETFEKKADEKQINSMHPLWEEYRWPVPDGEAPADGPNDRFYVNPYSGELSLEFPKIQQSCLGGILADEMGLGKTISTMSVIHSSPNAYSSGLEKTSAEQRCFASSTTLIVAPMSLLTQWESEAKVASKPGTIDVLVYYGDERAMDLEALCLGPDGGRKPKAIITSYGTVASEWQKHVRNASNKLFQLHFLRVVLDEAHTIRNRAALTSRACCALRADRKWALTGTPIVNRLEDLYSLVKFLGVEPWSHFPFWRTFITAPYESKDFLKALDVVQTVLEPIILRRTKSMKQRDGSPLIVLPPKNVHIEHIQLTDTEREVYDLFYRRAKQTFTASVAAGTVLKSYTTIFAQILRLRQSCDHPSLVQSAVRKDEIVELDDNGDEKSKASLLQREDDVNLQQLIDKFNSTEEEKNAKDCYGYEVMQQILKETERECLICSTEPITDQVVTPCWHMSCRDCLLAHIKYQRDHGQKPRCHSCRAEISEKEIFEVVHHSSVDSDKPEIALRRYKPQSSAKISRLLSQLKTIRQEEPSTKSVVFSQFTSFLDLIQDALQRDRYKCLRIDGSTVQRDRARVLEQFKREKGEIILLLSLKTGGVGLNLVSANKVFMMDPWWSFAVESQAIDRIHRMGQTQSVSVYRFIVKGSVEERMLKIQDRKKFLASSLGMSEDQKKMQKIEEIKLLFD
ncbi:SNF2 family N-terminal domain-containing protein [Lipomyces kononenkoae]|uniref:SNF2 family N-terminal domain-containing protein n=1 Tax=Lipomyces kononenkoae TaxID=34357 RepID=A0ACC3SZ65_LIPKO